jgi:hypothetical protein
MNEVPYVAATMGDMRRLIASSLEQEDAVVD